MTLQIIPRRHGFMQSRTTASCIRVIVLIVGLLVVVACSESGTSQDTTTSTLNTADTTMVTSSPTVPRFTDAERTWLLEQLDMFIAGIEDNGEVFGPSEGWKDWVCAELTLREDHSDPDLVSLGAFRSFRADRTTHPFHVHPNDPSYTGPEDPGFMPTQWLVALSVEFSSPDWSNPQYTSVDKLEMVRKLTGATFWVQPLAPLPGAPTPDCQLIDTIDTTESLPEIRLNHTESSSG